MRLFLATLLLCCSLAPALASEVPADPADISPIMAGEQIPAGLQAHRADGTAVDLTALLAQPTILIVFRGGWCPYCSRHLEEMASIESDLTGLGYQLVGLSPDRPGKAAEVAEKLAGSSFTVLSDASMEVCRSLGLAYEVQPDLLEKYKGYGIDLEADSGHDHHQLPVPAAMVITDSVVRFSYVNPDYRSRVNAQVLLAAARAARTSDETGR